MAINPFQRYSVQHVQNKTINDGLRAQRVELVTVPPVAPTDILTNPDPVIIKTSDPDNHPIALLSAVDGDANDFHSFEILIDESDSFKITTEIMGPTLRIKRAATEPGIKTVTIRCTDSYGLVFDKTFAINVLKVVTLVNNLATLFDGIDSHINFGNNYKFEHTDFFSLSLWEKKTNVANSRIIFTTSTGTGFNNRGIIIFHDNNANNRLLINLNNSGSNQIRVRYVLGSGTFDVWTHLAITYDGTGLASGIKVYLNGAILTVDNVLEDGLLGNTIVNATSDAIIGANSAGSAVLPSTLDEITWWDKELDLVDVFSLYNLGIPGDPLQHSSVANLTNWYRMGDGDIFPTVTDNLGSIDGAMTNMVGSDFVMDVPI